MPIRWLLTLLWSAVLLGQPKDGTCILDGAKNGDLVHFRGAVFVTGHDLFIRPTSCPESSDNRVILVWGDDPSLGAAKAGVRKDDSFAEFTEAVNATFPLPPGGVGTGRPRYRVVADFKGRLQVANSAGLKRDPKTKKAVGTEGFGHPMPFTRFRLVTVSVSHIEKTEQPVLVEHEGQHFMKLLPDNH